MKKIETVDAPAAIGPYSQGMISNGFIYTSGQLPIDPLTGKIEADTVEGQTLQVIKNIDTVLSAGGSDLSKVVKTTCFLSDIKDFGAFNEVYAKYFVSSPARICVEVSAIPKNALVEIEVVAEC
ncbi:MAG: RidA family protein [Dehalococcoidales bacterium]|nr:RidA family protein [Dehalococcoidales bacterium]